MTNLATLELGTSTVVLRRAEAGDIPAIVDLLSADRRNFQGIREARLIQSPLPAETADTTAYAIAS